MFGIFRKLIQRNPKLPMPMRYQHFIANSLKTADGYTWTLASRLGQMLHEVEELYGPRDMEWAILGVEFGPDMPQLWYPGNRKHVAIQLAMNALDNEMLACYQLAHETVHLLSPGGSPPAPVLEEGLATKFSEDFVAREFLASPPTNMASYAEAARCVRRLFDIDPHAIQKLRIVEPTFRRLTPESFSLSGLSVPHDLIDELLLPFDRK